MSCIVVSVDLNCCFLFYVETAEARFKYLLACLQHWL